MKWTMRSLFAIGSLLTLGAAAQDKKPFEVSPMYPSPGSKLTIIYRNQGTVLEGKKQISGIVYTYGDFKWKAADIMMKWSDTAWTASYQLPANTAILTCTFQSGDTIDKGGKLTYSWLLSDADKQQLPGAYSGWGMLRSPLYSRYAPFQVDTAAYIADEVMRMWFRNELRYRPASKPYIFRHALTLYKKLSEDDNTDQNIRSEINEILNMPNIPEQVWLDAKALYAEVLQDRQAADSLEQVILQRYPKGIAARDRQIVALTRETNLDKKIQGIDALVSDFPPALFNDIQTPVSDLYYNKLFRAVVYTPIMKDSNYNNLYRYLPMIPTLELSTSYHHLVEIPHEQQQLPSKVLLALSDTLVKELLRRKPDGVYSPSQWKAYNYRINAFIFYTHAQLLAENNQFAQALQVASLIEPIYAKKRAAFNDLYVQLLVRNKKQAAVRPYLLAAARENALTPAMLELLKKDYGKQHRNGQAFEAWIKSLRSPEAVAAHEAKIKSELVNKEIVPFKLESAKGGVADLTQLKGKIVVLDFWATWCAPCKAAMPGMQLAVNQYKADPGVAFYFIATQETKADFKEQINKFLREKQYTFEVLYDGYNAASGHQDEIYAQYAKAYTISGIPLKLIIDQQGRLRWINTGYMGSPSGLADEISLIIELLKKEQAGTSADGSSAAAGSLSSKTSASLPANTPAAPVVAPVPAAIPADLPMSTQPAPQGAAACPLASGPIASAAYGVAGTSSPAAHIVASDEQSFYLDTADAFKSEAVSFFSADKSIRLAGTLSFPTRLPAAHTVVLLSGTGKQDRDGNMAGHRFFASLADSLNRNGIAVLRVDDRGTGQSTGVYEDATTADLAQDALQAIAYLKTRKDIQPGGIGLIGHSEGGAVAAIAASKSADVQYIVSLAGLATRGLDALIAQNEQIVHAAPIPQLNKDRFNDINKRLFTTAYEQATSPALEQSLRDTFATWKKRDDRMIDSLKIQYDHFRFFLESYVRQAISPWYRFHVRFDPAPYLSKVQVPVLAIQGSKDLMLHPDNLAHWRQYIPATNKQVDTVMADGLNHLLQTCSTCTADEYAKLPEYFSPNVIRQVMEWIKSR